jgi:hypothetical protein
VSGGSFNYLCTQDQPQVDDLRDMAVALEAIAPDSKAAKVTRQLIDNPLITDELRDVWRAVEWWQSCDWSKGSVYEALGKYEDTR